MRRVRDSTPTAPRPIDTQRATRQLVADEFLLALLDRDIQLFVAAFEAARVVPGLADIAGREEQTGDDQLLHGVGVGARCVEDRNAARGQTRHGNVVGARPGARDGDDAGGNVDRVHVRRADQHGVRVAQRGGHFIVDRAATVPGRGPKCC